jgi:D-alanine--poly(phosphoribitol) ligase subunit 2
MSVLNDRLEALILECLREYLESSGSLVPPTIGPETELFSSSAGILDSLGLVSFLVAVEQSVEDALGVHVVLADDRALSRHRSPFRSIAALRDYTAELIEETR